MMNVQRERMRHLLSSAILELWKKETGSMTSVGIEATVCITSQNGRTITIQVSDHLPVSMPNGDNVQQEVKASNNNNNISVGNDQKSLQSHCRDYPTSNGQAPFSSPVMPETSPVNRNYQSPANKHDARISPKIKSSVMSDKPNHQSKRVCRNLWRGDEEADAWDRKHRAVNVSSSNTPRARLSVIRDDNNNNEVEESNPDLSPESLRWAYTGHDEDVNVVDRSSDEEDDLTNSSDLDGSLESKSPLRNEGEKHQHGERKIQEENDDDKNDSAIQDMSLDLSFSDCNHTKFVFPPCTPVAANRKKAAAIRSGVKKGRDEGLEEQFVGNGNTRDNTINSVMKNEAVVVPDANRQRDPDLYLSSPDRYTAQIRDVVRRQILSNASRTRLPLFPPSPLGVTDRNSTSWTHAHLSLSSDTVHQSRETPYSRSMVEGGGGTPIFWAPSTPTRLETKCGMNFPAPGPSQMDFKLFVPFLQPNIHCNNRSLATPTSSYGMIAPPCLSNVAPPNIGQSEEKVNESTVMFENKEIHLAETVQTPGRDFKDQCGSDQSVEQRVYRCDYCAKTFLFKSKYHEHLPVHTSARPFKCDRCSRTYKYKYDLRVHLRTHLGIPTKSTVCPFCTDKFGTNKLLRAHIKESHREQQLIGEEQCARSLEGLAAVRERNADQIREVLDNKSGQEGFQMNGFLTADGHREILQNQEGLDLSKPDGKFKSPKKDNNDCLELGTVGEDFRLHISS